MIYYENHTHPDEAIKQIAKDQYNRNPIMLAYRAEYVVATELSGAGDIMRIGLGLDPYTGEKLGWEKRKIEVMKLVLSEKLPSNPVVTLFKSGDKISGIYQGFKKEFNNSEKDKNEYKK